MLWSDPVLHGDSLMTIQSSVPLTVPASDVIELRDPVIRSGNARMADEGY
jgi:hypothetical protein